MSRARDDIGTEHPPAGEDARIVCLVPSITELVCALGLADRLVGRTGFCVHPWEVVRAIPKVGGTKALRMDRIRELAPTHVIVNVDENTRVDAETLRGFVPHVIVTHPLGPDDNPALYRLLGAIFGREREAEALVLAYQRARDRLARHVAGRPPSDVLYLIWREPWMTVAPDTYIARTLGLIGWRTLPRAPAVRYPEIDLTAYAGQVDRVLLSSEPFHFGEAHREEVAALVPGAEVSLLDGEMLSWYGSRAIAAMDYLSALADGGARAAADTSDHRVESPCIGVCEIDEPSGLCRGCGRSLAEIAAWGGADEAERRAIVARIAERPLPL